MAIANDETGMPKNKELEIAFKKFMQQLQDDISLYLGEKVPFMLRLDVKIGVEPKNENKMKVYEPRLSNLLNKMPAVIKPVDVKKEDK
jgi:hypothetical protein